LKKKKVPKNGKNNNFSYCLVVGIFIRFRLVDSKSVTDFFCKKNNKKALRNAA